MGTITWNRDTVPHRRISWPAFGALFHLLLSHAALLMIWGGLIASLIGWLASVSWLADTLLSFRLHYMLVTLAGTTLALFCQRKRAAKLGALILCLNALPLFTYLPVKADVPAANDHISVLTYNVFIENRDFDAVRAQIVAADADVVLLMEATPHLWDALAEVDDYPYRYEETNFRSSGMAIMSRYPLTIEQDPLLDTHLRSYLLMTVTGPAGSFRFLGVHTYSPIRPWNWAARNVELEMMAQFAVQQDAPLLIAGDLNVASWSPNFQAFLQDGALRDGRNGQGALVSWPTYAGPFGIPIDQAVTNEGLAILDMEALPGGGSDHRPILTRLEMVGG